MYYFDWSFILIIIGAVICIIASARVRSTYNKYNEVPGRAGITGAMAAERILRSQGLYDVRVQQVSGQLSDNYDPRSNVISLSQSTFSSRSVAAVAVAAHECGHALQYAENYAPLKIRTSILPVAGFGSKLAWPLIIIGLLIGKLPGLWMLRIGIILFAAAVVFQLVTLPVEFNASSRGLSLLTSAGILEEDEMTGSRAVLRAAALTYVAAAASSILQLLRLILIANGRSSRR